MSRNKIYPAYYKFNKYYKSKKRRYDSDRESKIIIRNISLFYFSIFLIAALI